MDWASIVIAAISGGIGGAVGGLLGGLFGERAQSTITVIFVIAAVVVLPRFIEPYVEPVIGPALRDATGQTAAFEEQLEQVMAEPIIEAVVDGDPAKEKEIRERLTEAYRTGGIRGFAKEVEAISTEFGETTVFAKLPYARDQDIISLFQTSVDILRLMEFENPAACYQWSYGAQYNDELDPIIFEQIVGRDLNQKLMRNMVAIVKNAGDMPVVYDRAGARFSIQQTAAAVIARLDQGTLQVIGGVRPAKSDEEKRAVCRATGNMYAFIIGLDNASDTFREMFRPREDLISHLGTGGRATIRQIVETGDPENIFAGKDLGPIYSLRPKREE